jgi:hypothetical protein
LINYKIRGFSLELSSGTSIKIDIPEIKFCIDTNMYCFIELTTSFTINIENPYTLNYYKANVGFVAASTYATYSATPVAPTFDESSICMIASNENLSILIAWTFTWNLAS